MNSQELKGQIRSYDSRLDSMSEKLERLKKVKDSLIHKQETITEGITILTAVLSVSQTQILEFIRGVVATALQYVYGDDYNFRMEFEFKRNQAELVLTPVRGDLIYDPRYSCGVGVVDVCSFALRIALWALKEPRSSAVIIADEPFRHVHGTAENERLTGMIKNLSKILGLQFIIITGDGSLQTEADRVFEVVIKDGESVVTQL